VRSGEVPDPVQRYLEAVVAPGVMPVRRVEIRQEGMLLLGSRWCPYRATQRVDLHPPGFDWRARVRILPGIRVHVRDAYGGGRGFLHARLLGLFTVARLEGGGETARSELLRYLAETPWYPTALLPGEGVTWEAVDPRAARATLVDGETVATVTFRFGSDGLVGTVRAEARPRQVGKELVPTPWEGRFRDYAWRGGLRIPLEGEVAWLLPEGRRTYWRGRIVGIRYAAWGVTEGESRR
jgi:hypothetical protein